MTQPKDPQEPREFWIDDILNVDRPSQKTAYIHEQDTEKCHRVIHVIEFSAYQSLQQKVSELEAEKKRSELFVPELNEQSYTQALRMCHDLQSKLKILEAENKRLADEARLLRFHITKELPNSKEIYECIAKALKGEEK